jgi:hypothetical protein
MPKELRPRCEHCGRPLVAIGRARVGGKATHDDWDTRTLHKKCWREIQQFGVYG